MASTTRCLHQSGCVTSLLLKKPGSGTIWPSFLKDKHVKASQTNVSLFHKTFALQMSAAGKKQRYSQTISNNLMCNLQNIWAKGRMKCCNFMVLQHTMLQFLSHPWLLDCTLSDQILIDWCVFDPLHILTWTICLPIQHLLPWWSLPRVLSINLW